MGVRKAYERFFATTPADAQKKTDSLDWARGTLALWGQAAFTDLMARMRAKADQPLLTSADVATMAGSIGRANGIREVLKMIDFDRDRARRILDQAEVYEDESHG